MISTRYFFYLIFLNLPGFVLSGGILFKKVKGVRVPLRCIFELWRGKLLCGASGAILGIVSKGV